MIGLADRVENRVVAPFRGGEPAILALLFVRRRRSRHPAKDLAPGLEPFGPGLRSCTHQCHRIARRDRFTEPKRRNWPERLEIGHRLVGFQPVGPELHQHLLGAAHHQRPVLPVLQRRVRARAVRFIHHCANVGLMSVSPQIPSALELLDYFGIAVFAVSGALLAAEKKQTLVTFIFFAVITGVGGGTMRDLLIGAPGFWVHTNATLLFCIGAALGVWFLSQRAIAERALLWFDAIGLAAYATYGAAKALRYGVAPVPAFAMGVITACVGGIIRDVLAGEPSILMRPELYVTAAALASGLFVILALFGAPPALAALVAGLAAFSLRGAAIARGLSLPAYNR